MYVCGGTMKDKTTIVLTIIVFIFFIINAYVVIFAPDKGIVTGKVWTKNARYLVIENDGQSGLVWVSWSVYFDAEKGDLYDTECDCIVGKP